MTWGYGVETRHSQGCLVFCSDINHIDCSLLTGVFLGLSFVNETPMMRNRGRTPSARFAANQTPPLKSFSMAEERSFTIADAMST
jgi:hypothetical protein